jgi:hypothetical protein
MWCRFRASWHFAGCHPARTLESTRLFAFENGLGPFPFAPNIGLVARLHGPPPLTWRKTFAWGFALRALAGGPGPGPPPLAWRRTFRTRGRGAVLTLIRRRLAFCFAGLLHLRGDVFVKFLATRGACASSRSPTSVATRFREIPGPRRGRNQALPLFSDPATVFSVAVPRPHGLRCVALAFGRGLWSPPSAASVFSIGF